MHETLPDRQSIRLKGWDYSSPGWYFVTICVQDMRSVFGTIIKGNMVLNDVGRMVQEMWLAFTRNTTSTNSWSCRIMCMGW